MAKATVERKKLIEVVNRKIGHDSNTRHQFLVRLTASR